MADHWWDVVHNKLYGGHPWKYHSFVGTEPNTWEEYIRPVMVDKSAALGNEGSTQSGRPQNANHDAATTASQFGEKQGRNYESDGLLSEGLGSDKENIRGGTRSTAAARRSVQRPRPRARSAPQTRQRQRRNTLDRLLDLSIGPEAPGSPPAGRGDEAQISDVLGPMGFWRNRAYRVQKRVGDFLGRTGSIFYPAYSVDESQLDALTVEIDRKENPLPSPEQVSEGEPVSYPDISGQVVGSAAAAAAASSPPSPPPPDAQAQVTDSDSDGDDATPTVPQGTTLSEVLGEQEARELEERLQKLREDSAVPIEPDNPGPQEAVPGKAIALAALTPPSPSSSIPRSFHISQTAHLAPSFVAARHHLRQTTVRRRPSPPVSPQPTQRYLPTPSPPPPSSSPTPTPSPRSSRRRSSGDTSTGTSTTTATTTATNYNSSSSSGSNSQTETYQAKSTQLLWDSAKRTREIWFGVGPGTGRDVGGRKGQGRRV
ncbi:uncharacterized protein F4812DRAFT_186692 [Daldinia caldariorum]|uniref:uncharacterized protein n=1 Tax=Daldinia caldariorum TaxID=326644 RepID=UPI002008CEC5|nr:uncharacterized protein F4812DRAFT_186692 [Daldinia caldariorum]KAI1471620.1 hypothetical protein F4812DRAFT_186692 [Daldinia caldariorum]